MARQRVLIIEDLPSLSLTYSSQLEKAGYEAVVAETGEAGLRALREDDNFAALLLDLQLPDMDGLEMLAANPEILDRLPVVVATANASLSRAVEAMRLGAFDFVVKPIAGPRLVAVMESAIDTGKVPLAQKVAARRKTDANRGNPVGFVGDSPAMQDIYRDIRCVARSRATVFITGESGTGKEVCAQAIHDESGRQNGPFIAINCGAIPENLLESELFGHLKGSFTGAVSDRIGAVQAAHKGTLFLDEICEMELSLQVKLLRFLQTGKVQRVGSNRTEEVDVRIVCATNRNPQAEVAEGRFREDLFYRLAVLPMEMPPLRERGDDICLLAQHFLQRFSEEESKHFDPLNAHHRELMQSYNWPGNVRELQNVLRRAVVLNEGPQLPNSAFPKPGSGIAIMAHVVRELETDQTGHAEMDPATTAPMPVDPTEIVNKFLSGMSLEEVERYVIQRAITAAGGSLPAAARELNVSASTLYRKREKWENAGDGHAGLAFSEAARPNMLLGT